MDNDALLRRIVDIAQEAGREILAVYSRDFSVTEKEDSSPLTEADLASHRVIVSGLSALTPDLPVLSEESREISWDVRKTWETYWLVDPLDGTKEFIKRNGEFTVNIALVSGHRVELGVVYAPVLGRTFHAAAGRGAFVQAGDAPPHPIRVSTRRNGEPWRVVGSRSHASPALSGFLARLGEHELVSMGSSLKFCLVAEGKAHIYPRLGPTSEWDTAAAQCLVEEAGGAVVTLDGAPLLYNAKPDLLNPFFIASADPSMDWRPFFS